MENVLLIVHLILALCLIAVVLLQRSEGGGLGMGGGPATGRAAATPLGKVTWAFAVAFICTSLALTVTAAMKSQGNSVLDRIVDAPAPAPAPALPTLPGGDALLPPGPGEAAPLVPRSAD